MNIYGKDFALYIECQTLLGSVMLPICEAKSVQLQYQSELGLARRKKDVKWRSSYYKFNSYTLTIDGYIVYSDAEIQKVIIAINNALLAVGNKLVSIGGSQNPVGGYFCLENALFDWEKLKWEFEGTTTPIRWSGEVLIPSLSASFNPEGMAEFSTTLQGNGQPDRFHTPIPTDLKLVSQSNTLPTESLSSVNLVPVQNGSIWTSGFTIEGNPLPTGKISTLGIDYLIQIGDSLPEIVQGLASAINGNLPAGALRAYSDDDTLNVEKDNNSVTEPTYINHTATLRSVFLSFQSAKYDFYRIKVVQGLNTWFVDVTSSSPTIILPTGSYILSVSGMGSDLQYSDYSETINITIN